MIFYKKHYKNSGIAYMYLSPCFKLKKKRGYSCLHDIPITPVSSRALYLCFERSKCPAKNSLHSYK